MAIKKSIIDKTGVTHAEAYVLIHNVFLSHSRVSIEAHAYHNAAARSKDDPANTKSPFVTFSLTVPSPADAAYFADTVLDDADKSPFKQAYGWLKTQNVTIDNSNVDFATGTTDV